MEYSLAKDIRLSAGVHKLGMPHVLAIIKVSQSTDVLRFDAVGVRVDLVEHKTRVYSNAVTSRIASPNLPLLLSDPYLHLVNQITPLAPRVYTANVKYCHTTDK